MAGFHGSVRLLPKELSQPMTHTIESREVNFVADVHLIQILGEQLISSEKVGILELIKNSYDAGANKCEVLIEKCPDLPVAPLSDPIIESLPGPVITVIDNGSGMNEEIILNGWLRPATTLKTTIKERLKREKKEAEERGAKAEYDSIVSQIKSERGGRLPIGEKGVGRFAVHRLGRYLILQTKTKDEPYEWVLKIDWNDFVAEEGSQVNLDSVKLSLIKRVPERDYGITQSGTVLRIYGGREGFNWTEESIKDIGNAITLMRSPYIKKELDEVEKEREISIDNGAKKSRYGFDVHFHAPQLSIKEFRPPTETVPAPITCLAIVDEYGIADIQIDFTPPQTLHKPLAAGFSEVKGVDLREQAQKKQNISPNYWLDINSLTEKRKPACGPFILEVKVWYRLPEWIDAPEYRTLTSYLDNFGGVGVFRDGLSILPAQKSSQDDWLGLSQWQIKKGENISYYNFYGSIDIEQEHTLDLIDRTSREGLLETQAYKDLVILLQTIFLTYIEISFKDYREKYNRLVEGERIPDAVLTKQSRLATDILERVSKTYDFTTDSLGLRSVIKTNEDPKSAVASLVKTFDQLKTEVRHLRDQTDALLEAAGYGIAIAVSLHEIEKNTANLSSGLDRLLSNAVKLPRELYQEVDEMLNTAETLLTELRRLSPLKVTRLEAPRAFQIRDSIVAASGAFRLTWKDANISFYVGDKTESFEVHGSFGMCSQIFANLLDNATYWITSSASQERRIMIRISKENRSIVVADSGPGISDFIRPHLFKLYYSLKNPPSGLGLYICKYYMGQMGGVIRESHDNERIPGFKGAQFSLMFPEKEN